MAFPLALPVALSAIQSLVKFRGRLDTILALNETTTGLPFALPPPPAAIAEHVEPMVEFFRTDAGQGILALRGLERDWKRVEPDPRAPAVRGDCETLLAAYFEACDITPKMLGPDDTANRVSASKAPSKEMRLAYYVVESHRLSRNPAVTRVLLAAADTLLEFGADHAGLFIAHPHTRGLVESLLREFAAKRDWDDAGAEIVFKTLLGSTALAALENRGNVPRHPLVATLFAALGDVQTELDADFVARLVTRDGFRTLIEKFLVRAADAPALLPDTPVLKESLAAMLRVTGANLDGILGDPNAITGVLEAGIAAAAEAAVPLIDRRIGSEPLLAAVLKSTASEFKKAADARAVFRTLGDGTLFAALYRATLRSVAASPAALADATGLNQHAATWISACADELAKAPAASALSAVTTRAIAVRALEAASRDAHFLARHGAFARTVLGATLSTTASALQDGFTQEDLLEIAEAIGRTAAANAGLATLDDRLRETLHAFALVLTNLELAKLASPARRKQLFFAALESLALNPKTWDRLAQKQLAPPLLTAVVHALAARPGALLGGPALVATFRAAIVAVARHGRGLLDATVKPGALETILTTALLAAENAADRAIDGETLPVFIGNVVRAFLTAPVDLATPAALEALIAEQLKPAA